MAQEMQVLSSFPGDFSQTNVLSWLKTGSELEENSIPDSRKIGRWLKDVIKNHQRDLRKMYGETEDELNRNLEVPIKKGEEMARKLITEMGCPPEIAKDLAVLTLYDVAILISMSDARFHSLGLVLLIIGLMDR